MLYLLALLAIFILFFALGKAADIVVYNTRSMAEKIGVPVFFLGLILGVITTLPETAVGINAVMEDVPEIVFGNLMGGIVVILCLILGISLVLNLKTRTDGRTLSIFPILCVLPLPLFLGLSGKLNAVAGAVMIFSYFAVVFYFYKTGQRFIGHKIAFTGEKKIARQIILVAFNIILVIIFSDLIVRLALFILDKYTIAPFFVGLLVFSLGTNLPEIMVMLRSWKRKVAELSLSHLLGAAMAHILILGLFSFLKPMAVVVDASYIILLLLFFWMLMTLLFFYKSDRLLTRAEGCVLIFMYFAFALSQLYFAAR